MSESIYCVSQSVSDDEVIPVTVELPSSHCTQNLGRSSLPQANENNMNKSCIHISSKNEDSKVKNRRLPCFFCDKFFYHMIRHIQRQHDDEQEVAICMENSPGKALSLRNIVNQGVYKHNINVLQKGEGTLIVGRAPKKKRSAEDFLPCQFCMQFFVRRELYRHCRTCKFRPSKESEEGCVSAGSVLLQGSLAVNSTPIPRALAEDLFSRMHNDRLTRVAKCDPLILDLESSLLQKLGPNRALDISARMRELARLVTALQQLHKDKSITLNSVIGGSDFDEVMTALETEAGPRKAEGGRQTFDKPAFVIKDGSSLLKCANLKKGRTLRDRNSKCLQDAKDFIALYMSEFTDRLASAAHASYRLRGNSLSDFPQEAYPQTLA